MSNCLNLPSTYRDRSGADVRADERRVIARALQDYADTRVGRFAGHTLLCSLAREIDPDIKEVENEDKC